MQDVLALKAQFEIHSVTLKTWFVVVVTSVVESKASYYAYKS